MGAFVVECTQFVSMPRKGCQKHEGYQKEEAAKHSTYVLPAVAFVQRRHGQAQRDDVVHQAPSACFVAVVLFACLFHMAAVHFVQRLFVRVALCHHVVQFQA